MNVRICPECGTENPADSWSCSKCGDTLSIATLREEEIRQENIPSEARNRTTEPPSAMQDTNAEVEYEQLAGESLKQSASAKQAMEPQRNFKPLNIVCPIDGNDDAMQKVSAVVAAGHAKGTFTGPMTGVTRSEGKWGLAGGIATLSGSTTTDLARSLAPPPEPRKRAFGPLNWLGLSIALILFGVIPGLLGLASIGSKDSSGFGMFLFGTAMVGIFIWRMKDNPSRKSADEVARRNWKTARERWAQLYYCHKHDLVFDPSSGETANTQDLSSLIYAENQIS